MYVDGFVFVVSKKKMPAYLRLARTACKVWMEHGALEYKECVGDHLNLRCGRPFPRLMKLKRGETACFSWVAYKSRKHRDQVNRKVMKDKRIASLGAADMPFDMKRMSYGGFNAVVEG